MNAAEAFRVCTYLWTIWVAIWFLWALQSKRTQQSESVASTLSYAPPAWLAMVLMFFPRVVRFWGSASVLPATPLLAVAGIIVTALGFVFTLWARFTLGSNWSSTVTIKVGHELIRTGPYQCVRHPIYSGIIVAAIGTAIALDQTRGILSVFLLWLAFTIKRLKEEQFMRQTFGSQYTDYARTTGAIFPVILRR